MSDIGLKPFLFATVSAAFVIGYIVQWELYWMPIPGVAICLLGAAAAWMTLRENMGRREKFLWVVFIFLLMIAEIAAITHDRGEQDKKHLAELGKQQAQFESQMRFLMGFKESVERDITSVKVSLRTARAKVPENSVKVITLQLAQDVLQFYADREASEPRLSPNIPWDSVWEVSGQYTRATIAEFHRKFDSRVIELVEKLGSKGIDPSPIKASCAIPNNRYVIRFCGENLKMVADKIP